MGRINLIAKMEKNIKIFERDIISPGDEKKITLESLKPPKETIISDISPEEYHINYSYLVNNSSFQRGINEFIKHIIPAFRSVDVRVSKEKMNQQFYETNETITHAVNVYHEIKGLPKELLQELQERFKLDNFGLTKIN